MNTIQSEPTVGQLVTNALSAEDRTETWLADHLGMGPSTLRRRIRSSNFSTAELVRISALLRVAPVSLLPESWHRTAA